MRIEIECPECHGTGYIFNGERDMLDEDNYDGCDWCCGNGVVYDYEHESDSEIVQLQPMQAG